MARHIPTPPEAQAVPNGASLALGEAIRARRTRRGMTLAQLAIALDASPFTVNSWERGRRLPSLTSLVPVAAALDTTVVDLLTGIPPFDRPT